MGAFRRALTVFGISVASLVPSASLTHWVMVEPDSDYYIDASSIQRQGPVATYTGKYTSLPNYAVDWVENVAQGKSVEYLVDRNQIHCGAHAIRFLKDVAYGPHGEVVASQEYQSAWRPIMPNSVAEDEWRFVCYPPPLPLLQSQAGAEG